MRRRIRIVGKILRAFARFWWRGMTVQARLSVRNESEALERYHDLARGWETAPRDASHDERDAELRARCEPVNPR